jgi:hypothetical protein
MKTARFSISLLLSFALTYLVQRWDRKRLTDDQRAGAWNGATWGAALYAFGPLSMMGWVWVTRQDVRRWRSGGWPAVVLKSAGVLAVGLVAAVVLFALIGGVDELLRVLSGAQD